MADPGTPQIAWDDEAHPQSTSSPQVTWDSPALTPGQATSAIDRVSDLPTKTPAAPPRARLDIGPAPRSIPAGQVTEQAERAGTSPLRPVPQRPYTLTPPTGNKFLSAQPQVNLAAPGAAAQPSETYAPSAREYLTRQVFPTAEQVIQRNLGEPEEEIRYGPDKSEAVKAPGIEELGNIAFPGIGSAARGAGQFAFSPGHRAEGALRFLEGAMEAATPFMGPEALTNPVAVAKGFFPGLAMQQAAPAKRIVKAVGGDQTMQDLANQVDFLIPMAAGAVTGAIKGRAVESYIKARNDLAEALTDHVVKTQGGNPEDILDATPARRAVEQFLEQQGVPGAQPKPGITGVPSNIADAAKMRTATSRVQATAPADQARAAQAEQAVNTLLPSIAGTPEAKAAAAAAVSPAPVIAPEAPAEAPAKPVKPVKAVNTAKTVKPEAPAEAPTAPPPQVRGPVLPQPPQLAPVADADTSSSLERGAAIQPSTGVQSTPMAPEKGAGDKGAQPKQETPAGAETFYHGTNDAEAIRKQGFGVRGKDSPYVGDNFVDGVFLARDKAKFEEGGELEGVQDVLPVTTDAQKVKKVDGFRGILDLHKEYGISDTDPRARQKLTAALKADGYDAVDAGHEFVVLDPSKVKLSDSTSAPAQGAEAQPREPWQMTIAEFRQAVANGTADFPGKGTEQTKGSDFARALRNAEENGHNVDVERNRFRKATYQAHSAAVTVAYAEGKPVPASVLADYPDLAQPTPSAASPGAAIAPAAKGSETAAPSPHQFSKGDRVSLGSRTGEITYLHPKMGIARVRFEDGKTESVAKSKLKPAQESPAQPGPGSPEYEALKATLAKLQGKKAEAAPVQLRVQSVPGGYGVIGEGGKILARAKTRAKAEQLMAGMAPKPAPPPPGSLVIKNLQGQTVKTIPEAAAASDVAWDLEAPPEDIGVQQWIDKLPPEQGSYAGAAWRYLQQHGLADEDGFNDYMYEVFKRHNLSEDVAGEIEHHLRQLAAAPETAPREKPVATEPEAVPSTQQEPSGEQPEVQPARAAGGTENLSSLPEPARESGKPPTTIPSEGNRAPGESGRTRPSTRPADRAGVERSERLPQKRDEPARGGGTSPAVHPAPEREGRGSREPRAAGADGKPVEAPTPEPPSEAKTTTAELRNLRNYHISDEHASTIGAGGEITKIKGNLDALETLKTIQSEGRELATPEEQETLAKYVDFGGLVGMLQNHWKPEYAKHYERFNKLLTSDEIQEIRETLPNTHYTSMQVVDWMWQAMERMGFRGGRILEPGMGIGNFFGRMPEKVSKRSELLGVERNPLTGAMAKLLYPDAKIAVKPFQQFMVPDNTLDAVIGNVPFQDVTITDDPAYSKLKLNLHNYFIIKSLDKLKPGGIAALITSRYTMDAASGKYENAREEMAKRADLLAAIRLPDAAFKRTAGTEVVADLLIFQKRDPDIALEKMPPWTKVDKITVPGQEPIKKRDYGREYISNEWLTHPKDFLINKYFIENQNNVLGTHSQEGKMYGKGEYTVKSPADFGAALEGAINLIPEKVLGKRKAAAQPAETPSTLEPSDLVFAPEDVKAGAFYKDEKGNIRIKQSGVATPLPPELRGVDKQTHIGHAIDLRDQLNRTIETQLETADDAPLKEEQGKLTKLYDAYRKKYGPLHGSKLRTVFGDDPEYPKLLALENLNPETKEVSRADIFDKRVLAPYEPLRDLPDDPKAAMLKVMAERGVLDTKLMADLLGKGEQEVIDRLENENLIYQDPQGGKFFPADEYLSGNVRDKLRVAQNAADTDPKYKRNVEALKAAQPAPLTIHDIQPALGQTWIPIHVYKGFLRHLAGGSLRDLEINRDATGKWLVRIPSGGATFDLNNKWAGGGIPGHKLVQYALNQQQPTVWINHSDGTRTLDAQATAGARDKLAAIKEEFRTVLRRANQETVDKLEQIYNDTFNSYRLREFSGEHLDFPGMSEKWRGLIRGYQKAAVWRILQEGRGGIFHAPGLGKTLTMATAGMEARRLKLSRKNMYVVPNSMIPQWREDFKKFYPNANVLAVLDEDFTPTNRARLMSRIATGDWDAVLIPHSQFDLLPMSAEWEARTIGKRLADYRRVLEDLDEKDDKRTIKQIEKQIDKLESRLHELNDKKKDVTIPYDKLGVDMLFVDEAHAYKAMAVPSRMGNIGGISNRASQRAFALEMKADFMRETHKGRGLVFGTGTPITNTMGELYVMTKYLAPEMLEASGIRDFDDWAANFATTRTELEYAPDGVTFRPRTTLSEFVNVPELSTMFRRYAEYISKEGAKQLANLKLPEVERKDHMVKTTPTQEPLLQMIAERGEHLIKHPPRTKEERQADNWLKLSSDARKISLDPRLYDSDLKDDKGSKVNEAVKTIKEELDATKDKLGAVAVFSDFFQHKDEGGKPDFNIFEDIRSKLVKLGVPREQIAIIHEAKDKEALESLFAKVRAGKVRVIFGSTDKMGVGVNIQDRLYAEHHLDQPWRPDQVEQREGRIERSGNSWDKVRVHRYIAEPAEGTVKRFDPEQGKEVEKPRPRAYDLQMYQQLARKSSFQEQFLTGNYKGRSMEDVGGDVKLNSEMFQLGKAMATGNPDAMRKFKIEHDMRTYELLERNFQVTQSKQARALDQAQLLIPVLKKKIQLLERDTATWQKHDKEGGNISVAFGDTALDTKEKREEYIKQHPGLTDLLGKTIKVGGLETQLEAAQKHELNKKTGQWEPRVVFNYRLAGEEHQVPTDDKGESTVRNFLNSFAQRARGLGNALDWERKSLTHQEETLAGLQKELTQKSPYIDKLEAMQKEIQEINARMGVTVAPPPDEGVADDEDQSGDETSMGLTIPGIPQVFSRVSNIFRLARAGYESAIERVIDQKLKVGDKYFKLKEHDPELANLLRELDNLPRYTREKAETNIANVTKGLNEPQVRLARLLADSEEREYLEEAHPDEYDQATSDPAVMEAVNALKPLQKEISDWRIQLQWPVRLSLYLDENTDAEPDENRWMVRDREGMPVADFETRREAEAYIQDEAEVEDHIRRTYPEHTRQPLPGETEPGPYSGIFHENGIRPPRADKKARIKDAEYFYQHGAKDFAGYTEAFRRAYEGILKQGIYERLASNGTEWKVGTAQPPEIEYQGKTYYRADIATKMREGGKKDVPVYAIYDPTRGERFLIKALPTEDKGGWSVLATGRPDIGANDRVLAPRDVVDALENYDKGRGGESSPVRKFFQTQIVGLFGPMVHINNIVRRIGQAEGLGSFDPRSWTDISKMILSPTLRARVLKGVDDATVDMLTRYGAYTDWRDIGSLHQYIGGNLNPLNWNKYGKGILFDPKFANGWGGLDPKARVLVADYLKAHTSLTDPEIARRVNDALGDYNRANWSTRQKQLSKYILFPGWDFASMRWFLRNPLVVGLAGAAVVMIANLVLNKLGATKEQDKYDSAAVHIGERRYRPGMIVDSFGSHMMQPVLNAAQTAFEGGDKGEIAGAAGEGFIRAGSGLANLLRPDFQIALEQIANRKYLGGGKEITSGDDRYIPGTVLPNRALEKRAAFALVKAFPAVNRFLDVEQHIDLRSGVGSVLGVMNAPYGAEQRLKANAARAYGYYQALNTLAETKPEEAERMVETPNKAVYLMFHNDLSGMLKDLREIDTETARLMRATEIGEKERKQALDDLKQTRIQVLKAAETLNDALFEQKVKMKAEAGPSSSSRSATGAAR